MKLFSMIHQDWKVGKRNGYRVLSFNSDKCKVMRLGVVLFRAVKRLIVLIALTVRLIILITR